VNKVARNKKKIPSVDINMGPSSPRQKAVVVFNGGGGPLLPIHSWVERQAEGNGRGRGQETRGYVRPQAA